MKKLLPFVLVVLAGAPAVYVRVAVGHDTGLLATLLFGAAIVAAAASMSWGGEAAEHDIPRALATVTVALLAVLPEYAVDIAFAWKAGDDPSFLPYAAANMTGSNRLLVGLGWPFVAILMWLRSGRRVLLLRGSISMELSFLAVATVYSFLLPLKHSISLIDSLLLIALFGIYAVMAARSESEEPELVGPAAILGALPTGRRRLAVVALLAFAGALTLISAEPFAEGLVASGRALGVDEFLLVQWLAPLASEAPEFLVAAILAWRLKPGLALAMLISAKVNQWTLLIGSLPIAYSLSSGPPLALPLDARQTAEVLLTAAQSAFALVVVMNRSFSLGEALALLTLFLAQFVAGGFIRQALPALGDAELHVFAATYLALTGAWIVHRAAQWTVHRRR